MIYGFEVARDLVHNGAEVIVVPTMTTTGDRPQEKIIAQSTAITHQATWSPATEWDEVV